MLPEFSYKGYAARLLTAQEVSLGCDVVLQTTSGSKAGDLSKCKYLLENTRYSNINNIVGGSWLESPRVLNNDYVWVVTDVWRRYYITDANTTDLFGVRPAIEVAKTDIDY